MPRIRSGAQPGYCTPADAAPAVNRMGGWLKSNPHPWGDAALYPHRAIAPRKIRGAIRDVLAIRIRHMGSIRDTFRATANRVSTYHRKPNPCQHPAPFRLSVYPPGAKSSRVSTYGKGDATFSTWDTSATAKFPRNWRLKTRLIIGSKRELSSVLACIRWPT